MTNHLAVAAVTDAIAQILREELGPHVPELAVSTGVPKRQEEFARARVNVSLYHAAPNSARRNDRVTAAPTGTATGDAPQVALDLHVLVSFFGRSEELVPQQLLARTAMALHKRAVITVGDQHLTLVPVPLSLAELMQAWAATSSGPYALSLAYQCTVVLREG